LEADIRSFLSYLRVEKGLSDNTMYAYQRDMLKFAEFTAKHKVSTGQIQRSHVVDFLRSLYLKKLDSRSVARHLVTLRHFFRFCFAEGLIKEDPAANIQSPKFRQSLPEFLSLAEVDRLLAQPDPTSTQPSGTVISQSPSGGTAPPGSTVTITVSGGALSVPTVVGDSQQTANQILSAAGFAVSVQQGSGPSQYANGTVFSQQPAANSTEPKGTTITIFVQNGASPSPSVTPSSTSPTPNPTGSGGVVPGF